MCNCILGELIGGFYKETVEIMEKGGMFLRRRRKEGGHCISFSGAGSGRGTRWHTRLGTGGDGRSDEEFGGVMW